VFRPISEVAQAFRLSSYFITTETVVLHLNGMGGGESRLAGGLGRIIDDVRPVLF